MKHIKPLTANSKALDWGLNTGVGAITALIQALISFITSLLNLKNPSTSQT